MARLDPEARAIAVTGVRTFLGTELLRMLEEDGRCARVVALDIREPEIPLEKTEFVKIDLTVPAVAADLARVLCEREIDTVVHAAFLSHPTHASSWAHELEDVGTMHLLNACAEVGPARLVLVSTTMVYGPSPKNPNFLREGDELKGQSGSRFVQDKVRAERQVARFAEEHPETRVTVLRFAPILGPSAQNLFTRFFSRPVAPVLMGHDPLLQFVHEVDAAAALKLAVDLDDARERSAVYNVVGPGVLPYSTVLALMGKLPLPMPHFVAKPLSRALWATQVADSPPSFLDFLRYLCVADGKKAREELGFRPRYDLKRTILDFLGLSGDDEDAPDIARAQG
jgi:UDP-glucose 4-epimerase